jgi:uncharacterized protein YndB with AHSA1/START domain
MEVESICVSEVIPATPERIYRAWLDDAEHSAFTGGKATVEPTVGGRFTAWDGYIEGVTQELVPGVKIAQRWRSTDFPPDAADSSVVVTFMTEPSGTLVTIEHTEIPVGQGKAYEQGWVDYYFGPMKTYFGSAGASGSPAKAASKPAAKKAAAKKPVAKKPAAKKAVAKKPAAKKAAATKAAAKKPAAKKAVSKKAAAKKPAAKKPAAKKPAAKKAVSKKPAAKKPAAKRPAAKKPAARKPSGERRAAGSTVKSPSERPPKP